MANAIDNAFDALSSKGFLAELNLLGGQLRKEIEAKATGLLSTPEEIATRRKRVLREKDFAFFCYTYFPHHIWGEPSQFQKAFFQRFPAILCSPNGCREWWIAPRGESKSTLATKIGPIWIVVQGLLQLVAVRREVGVTDKPQFLDYVMLLGAEARLPAKLLEVVKTELTVNTALMLDFPEMCGASDHWKIGEIVTRNGVRIESFGADQAIRGTFHGASRPKVLLPDDIITDKEARSPTERNNRWEWLENAVDYLGPPDGTVKMIGVGTILNDDDPISRAKRSVGYLVHHYKALMTLPNRMDLWERCEELMRNDDARAEEKAVAAGKQLDDTQRPSYKFYLDNKRKMDAGAETSWSSVRSLYWLMRQRAKNLRTFNREMQGIAKNDEDVIFSRYQFWVSRLRHWIMYAACDPSMGKSEKSDPSALLVGGFDTLHRKLHVLEAEIKRRVPSKLQSDMMALQQEYEPVQWAFENNNAYEYMRTQFMDVAVQKNTVLSLVGITATVSQFERIDSLEPFVTDIDPKILFHARLTQLLEELGTYPEKQSHHHYDGLVALHLLWEIAVRGGRGVPRIGFGNHRRQKTLRGYDSGF